MTTLAELRKLISDPPPHIGVLAIVHDFKWVFRDSPEDSVVEERIKRAMAHLRDLGFSGVVCNVSEKDYLRDEKAWSQFGLVLKEGIRQGLRIWIYDESGYPSGTAGGLVLREHPEYEAVGLLRLVDEVSAGAVRLEPPREFRYPVMARARFESRFMDLTNRFDESGALTWTAPEGCRIERFVCRRAFEGTHATLNVACVRRYINVLDPRAVRAFIEKTHAQYLARFPQLMQSVEAVFTDEPSFMTTYHPEIPERYRGEISVEDEPDPNVPRIPMVPWWEDLPSAFRAAYGYDLLPHLDCLFDEASSEDDAAISSRVRQDFYELLSRQYASAYFAQTQTYLDKHGIALTGHVLHEEPLWHHVASEGSTMSALAPMRIPGCDILTGNPAVLVESMRLLTPKYASSVAHLSGRSEVMSEVSDWQERNRGAWASIEERYGSLALQMMLGVTTFTSYYRWKEFDDDDVRRLLKAIARIGAMLRQGTHQTGIALLYPIRTVWARFIPLDHWIGLGEGPAWLLEIESSLHNVARSLFSTQRDFDFVDEDLLLNGEASDGRWRIGGEAFTILILPPHTILSEQAAQALASFAASGGTIIAFRPEPVVRCGKGLNGHDEPFNLRAGLESALLSFEPKDRKWFDAIAEQIPPTVRFDPPSPELFVRHSRVDEGDVYLIVNARRESYHGEIHTGGSPNSIELWDPRVGKPVRESPFEIEGYGARIILAGSPASPGSARNLPVS